MIVIGFVVVFVGGLIACEWLVDVLLGGGDDA